MKHKDGGGLLLKKYTQVFEEKGDQHYDVMPNRISLLQEGTLTLVPGDESLSSEVAFLNMQGSIQVVEDEALCPADVDGDGTIGFSDILAILNSWGACP